MCLDLEGTEDGSRNGWTTGHVRLLKRNTRHGKGLLILRNIRAMLISKESATRLQIIACVDFDKTLAALSVKASLGSSVGLTYVFAKGRSDRVDSKTS